VWCTFHLIKCGGVDVRRSVVVTQDCQLAGERGEVRVLIVGDSTGLGVGAESPDLTLGGLLAAEFGAVEIVNRCSIGARVSDAITQVQPLKSNERSFDLALILVGGNDVLRGTSYDRLAFDARRLLDSVRLVAERSIWMGSANVGLAPVFMPPLSWWLNSRSRRMMRVLSREAHAAGADFIDFTSAEDDQQFRRHRSAYFAEDGVHPSGAAYRLCFETLRRQPAVAALAHVTRGEKVWTEVGESPVSKP
jgi:lysophospholipase L1-like esterase